jgi:hypothetical protein
MIKRKMNLSLLSLSLLGIIFFGFLSTAISASTTYQLGLRKSTDEYTIIQYDDDGWKATINPASNPKEYFEGDANVTGAKSRQTIKGWADQTYTTYDALLSLFFEIFEYLAWNFTYQANLTAAGYNEATINANYTNTFNAWYGVSAEWWFTDGEFEETPNNILSPIIIMKDPSDFKSILDDCNAIIEDILNDPRIDINLKFLLSNKTADEFLWQLAFKGLAIAEPQTDYLESLVNELGCKNVTVSGSSLIIERYGLTNYTVEISYGEKGMMSSFTVKDIDGVTIYQITSSNSEWLFYLILIIVAVSAVAIVTFLIIRKKRLHR